MFTILCVHRDLASGVESKVPVLFLDLQDDRLTPCEDDPEGAVTTGELFAEKPDTMIELPIINSDQEGVSHCQAQWSRTGPHNTTGWLTSRCLSVYM